MKPNLDRKFSRRNYSKPKKAFSKHESSRLQKQFKSNVDKYMYCKRVDHKVHPGSKNVCTMCGSWHKRKFLLGVNVDCSWSKSTRLSAPKNVSTWLMSLCCLVGSRRPRHRVTAPSLGATWLEHDPGIVLSCLNCSAMRVSVEHLSHALASTEGICCR